MEGECFDAVAKNLTRTGDRRRVLRLLASGALAAAAARLGFEEAAAGCKLVGERCAERDDCCSNSRCKNKTCVCKQGFTNCAGRCRDLNNSRTSCGTCGVRCQSNEVCQSGDCCRPSFTLCTDVCQAGSNCAACCSGFCFTDNTC